MVSVVSTKYKYCFFKKFFSKSSSFMLFFVVSVFILLHAKDVYSFDSDISNITSNDSRAEPLNSTGILGLSNISDQVSTENPAETSYFPTTSTLKTIPSTTEFDVYMIPDYVFIPKCPSWVPNEECPCGDGKWVCPPDEICTLISGYDEPQR